MSINGHTGIVSELSDKSAKLKNIDATFGVDVVVLPDGHARPRSLLEYLNVGSTVHYDAVVNKATGSFIITKVWFSGTSLKKTQGATKHVPPASAQLDPTSDITDKALKKQIRSLLKTKPLPLTVIHTNLIISKPLLTNLYQNSLEGLKEFIKKRPTFVLSSDNMVMLKDQNGPLPTTTPTPLMEKTLKKDLQTLLAQCERLSLDIIYEHYKHKKPELAKVYFNTLKGLKKFIKLRSNVFLLAGENVSLVTNKGIGSTTMPVESDQYGLDKTIMLLKKIIYPRPGINLQSLLNLLIGCDLDVRAFVGNDTKSLREFLQSQDDVFDVSPQGTVGLRDVGIRQTQDLIGLSKGEATKNKGHKTENLEFMSVHFLKHNLMNGPLEVPMLVKRVSSSRAAIQNYIGTNDAAILKFVVDRPKYFMHCEGFIGNSPGNEFGYDVSPKKVPGKGAAVECSLPIKVAPPAKKENVYMDSLIYFREVLKDGGPLKISNLAGHLSSAPLHVRQYAGGGSPPGLLKFLEKHVDVFEVNAEGKVCSIQDGQNFDAGTDIALRAITRKDAVVRHVIKRPHKLSGDDCQGFILNGTFDYENIYFKSKSLVREHDSYDESGAGRQCLNLGDTVDCLYELFLSKTCKYRALGVWQKAGTDSSGGADSAIFLSPISVINSRVLYGQGEMCFKSDGMGYMKIRTSKRVEIVLFNLNHAKCSKDSWDVLGEGSQVLFVAVYMYTRTEPESILNENRPQVWNAIQLWPLSFKGSTVTKVGTEVKTWEGAADVQEVTCEGGVLSFGKDLWSERISFHWSDLMGNYDSERGPQYITKGNTVLCTATASPKLDTTKWVTSELFPPKGNPDLRGSKFDRLVPLKPLRKNSHGSKNAALFDFLSGKSQISDKVLTPPESRHGSCSGITNDGDLLTGSEWSVNDLLDQSIPNATNAMSYSSDDNSLSSKVNETDYVTEALDACSLHSTNSKDGGSNTSKEVKDNAIGNGYGKLVSKTHYGGTLESPGNGIVYFGAHSFYFNQRPIAHTAFATDTKVHFDAVLSTKGHLRATKVWIGKKP